MGKTKYITYNPTNYKIYSVWKELQETVKDVWILGKKIRPVWI